MDDALLQLTISGLAMGAIYGLVALGFTLIWNAVGIVNFAQGELVMLGGFVSVGWLTATFGMPWPLTLVLTCGFMAVFGVAMAWGLYHPLRNAPQLSAIVATLGLSIFLKNSAVLTWGPHPLMTPGPLGNATVAVAGVMIYGQYFLIIGALVVLMATQLLIFRGTLIGKAMRATAQDREVARLMGIPTHWIITLIFVYASVLAGIAGVLLAPVFYVSASMGGMVALKAFSASIIGGFGNIPGAVIGGLILGLVESLGSSFISSAYIDVISFGLLITFLVLRPQGIFGEPEMERP